MQEIGDIFHIWPSLREMATDLGEDYETVRKWRLRSRIPERAWATLIEKAALREQLVTASQLLQLNGPLKQTREERVVGR